MKKFHTRAIKLKSQSSSVNEIIIVTKTTEILVSLGVVYSTVIDSDATILMFAFALACSTARCLALASLARRIRTFLLA